MDKILLYQKISEIKPEYRKLHPPYVNPSASKILFNLKELDLHYLEEFGAYVTIDKLKEFENKGKKGGGPKKQILVVELPI